ncbi:GTP cyclohydrolase I FolE [Cellulomonas fimi]|uniref:GTP cyclohydrolase 1 n=1 Tax=Cellulomonas fimi TaxID=1708 RepID=A0A7Y0QHV3_CELFI|nr:GTP cyclohydrolase I FolE [Cellulomonas fimi]NMR20279.1 GTP cyclohydrolase I FolE [Cellulomonas fimi]
MLTEGLTARTGVDTAGGGSPVVDLSAAERAAAAFLAALGVPLDSESRRATPGRMARAYAEMLTPRPFEPTTFPNDEGYDELVLARSLPVRSVCEHHLLPFVGVAHVGYLPGERILGLSKLARVVEMFARRPQVQERLTQQVANWMQGTLAPRGVGVVVEAEHMCMSMRGVGVTGASTTTSALHGLLRDDARSRAEFFALVDRPGAAGPGPRPHPARPHPARPDPARPHPTLTRTPIPMTTE